MPRKDYESHKQYMRDRYHHKIHGAPAPPVRTPMTAEEWSTHRVDYQRAYAHRPGMKEHRHDLQLRRDYGITWERKVEMYQEQQGLCGLCNLPLDPEISKACTDHNHVTGEVRKLLHKQCNSVVAYFEEDSARINTLLDYLL